ncbi:MAG: hypothetical protein DWQ09_05680 [Proteobacteria bacterium]|nr:MAG: hypothetical protein DWQ09_05680 [Pseudomonadota bacterium]QKK11437.1 MAG: hypothetical protein HND59_07370 [Pseudomonadota bacterium]
MPLLPLWFLVIQLMPSASVAEPLVQRIERCIPDGFVYQWRDAAGRLYMGDCAPSDAQQLKRVPRASLQPTLIQSPPKPASNPPTVVRKSKRNSRSRDGKLSPETLRGLSAKCRWLVGRIEHIKGLVKQHRTGSRQPSIWEPELDKRRGELRKARCGVSV